MVAIPQKIVIFQQNNSGKGKIEGITRFGNNLFNIEVVAIDQSFPPVIDDTDPFLPEDIQADLVLDFLEHPDLSHDLALICQERNTGSCLWEKKQGQRGSYPSHLMCASEAGLSRKIC